MNILVLGGSYFLGKHFVKMAYEKHHVTVFNRGNRKIDYPGILHVTGDRNDAGDLAKLSNEHYDVVVDFCAYHKGDIKNVVESLACEISQYIFISTVDVYEHGTGRTLDENAPFEYRNIAGEVGEYIAGKVALEAELVEEATKHGFAYTSIRPAMIYGPDNYAPRESMYFYWIESAGQIIHPTDATGEFQLVYVEDVARAILNAIGNDMAYDRAFNIVPDEIITYDSFASALRAAVDKPFEIVGVPIETVMGKGVPLPFPLTKDESNHYTSLSSNHLVGNYTDLVTGLSQSV